MGKAARTLFDVLKFPIDYLGDCSTVDPQPLSRSRTSADLARRLLEARFPGRMRRGEYRQKSDAREALAQELHGTKLVCFVDATELPLQPHDWDEAQGGGALRRDLRGLRRSPRRLAVVATADAAGRDGRQRARSSSGPGGRRRAHAGGCARKVRPGAEGIIEACAIDVRFTHVTSHYSTHIAKTPPLPTPLSALVQVRRND